MKKIKWIVIMLFSILFVTACEKDETHIDIKKDIKYSHRAVKISSSNVLWGKYTLNLVYKNERLRSGVYTNEKGVEVGYISVSYLGETVSFKEYHYVATVENAGELDPDEVEWVTQMAKSTDIILKDGVVMQEQISTYGRIENGYYYDYEYYLLAVQKNICEYDNKGNLAIIRQTGDYENEITPRKINYFYNGKRLERELIYDFSLENWREIEKNEFIYNPDLVQIVNSELGNNGWKQHISTNFIYSKNQLTIDRKIDNVTERSSKFEFNDGGFVTKITDRDVVTMVVYESGHGNYSLTSSILVHLSGMPFIK